MTFRGFVFCLLLSHALARGHDQFLRKEEKRQVEQLADGQIIQIQDGQIEVPSPSSAQSSRNSACSSTTSGASNGPTATLDCGIVIGTTTSLPAATATVNKFLGIPFAQSPPQRFSLPQKAQDCNVKATAFKPACIQQFVYPKLQQEFTEAVFNNPAPEESEDCLYLNVYAPSSPPPADGRAVLYWIYGGSLEFGSAGLAFYDGSYFAAYEDVIVVTVNYRTNVFGFATSDEIPVTQRNLGFYDQRAGLDWVQENIARFGGNPDKVTIFGESAGAFSVDALLTSFPADSKPPFRGAILESGQISYNPQSRPSTVPQWNQLAGLLGCPGNYGSNLTCLRAANASAIKNAIEVNILTFNPTPDNITLVPSPMKQRLSRDIAPIPILAGTNSEEGRVFTVTTAAQGEAAWAKVAQAFTDFAFQCGAAYQVADTASIGIPAWRYYFNASFYNTQAYPGLGVFHSSEIPLVFSTYPRQNATTQEAALSDTMRGIWAKFAKNPAGGPGWNAAGTGSPSEVLVGAISIGEGGTLIAENGTSTHGSYNLAVLGNRFDALGSGVTVIDSSEVDTQCEQYRSEYAKNAVIGV